MHLMSKATLVVCVALAAVAIAAGSASASAGDPVEVIDNATMTHCNPICSVHFTGSEIKLRAHVPFFGELLRYNCGQEFDLNVNEDGTGNIAGVVFTNPGEGSPNDCTEIVACETPWPGSMAHTEAGTEYFHLELCIDTPIVDCEGGFVFVLNESFAGQSSETSNSNVSNSVCEFQPSEPPDTAKNHWADEGKPLTVNHL